MTERTNKPIAVKLNPIHGLYLLGMLTCAGEMSFGGWGWFQPSNDDDLIMAGDVYLSGNRLPRMSIKDLLSGSELGYERTRALLKEWGENGNGIIDFDAELEFSGLYAIDEVHVEWGELEQSEKVMYRLKVLWVNTWGGACDFQNWCIPVGEYLAEMYIKDCDGLYLYEPSSVEDQLLGDILESGHLPEPLRGMGSELVCHQWENPPSYDAVWSETNRNINHPKYSEFVKTCQDASEFDDDTAVWDALNWLIARMTGHEREYSFDDDIIGMIAVSAVELVDLYNTGDLELHYDELPDDTPKVLKDVIRTNSLQTNFLAQIQTE